VRPQLARNKNIGIYEHGLSRAPDGVLVALDANGRCAGRPSRRRGQTLAACSWPTQGDHQPNLSAGVREFCFIVAHDAKTGKELWNFLDRAPGEPGGDTWPTCVEQRAPTWACRAPMIPSEAHLLGHRQSEPYSA